MYARTVMLTGLACMLGGIVPVALAADGSSTEKPETAQEQKLSALGTLEPREVVDVGPRTAGPITRLYVDYGSPVEKGMILATIDNERCKANVEVAEAKLQQAKAEFELAKATIEHADAAWKRAQNLAEKHGISEADLDDAQFAATKAKLYMAAAAAAVGQAQAGLKAANIELECTVIRSPIKGEVVDRRVNMGQTVSPSLNADSLFVIADTDDLEIWVSVNEADIAKVHRQQAVHFTVDAFPGEAWTGTVKQVRHNATMRQNVVTYTVVIAVPKSTQKLLPYMTAKVAFE